MSGSTAPTGFTFQLEAQSRRATNEVKGAEGSVGGVTFRARVELDSGRWRVALERVEGSRSDQRWMPGPHHDVASALGEAMSWMLAAALSWEAAHR